MFYLCAFLCIDLKNARWDEANKHCFKESDPPRKGNSLYEWVSAEYVQKFNTREQTPVEITEIPLKEVTIAVGEVSSYLQKNKFASKELADKIQKTLQFSSSISSAFHDFGCIDQSSKFNSLPNNQKNIGNFWNKIITRSAVLVKANKINNSVTLKVKRVNGQMKKRWTKLTEKKIKQWEDCHINYRRCGDVTTKRNECHYKYNVKTRKSEYKCEMVDHKENKCETKYELKQNLVDFRRYKHEFTDSMDKTEVQNMFNSVQKQIAARLKF